jgi:hypothetical protein
MDERPRRLWPFWTAGKCLLAAILPAIVVLAGSTMTVVPGSPASTAVCFVVPIALCASCYLTSLAVGRQKGWF